MSTTRKKDQTATAVAQVNTIGRPTRQPHTVEDVIKLVVVNGITVEMAIRACGLNGVQLPYSTLYSRIQAARKKGTYNNEIRREYEKKEKKLGLIIDVSDDCTTSRDDISPVTMTTINSASAGGSDTTITTKKLRQSSRQASIGLLEAKRVKLNYDGRYKKAFKDATNLVVANAKGEPIRSICNRLNHDFKLDGTKRLARSTVYQAGSKGWARWNESTVKGSCTKHPRQVLTVGGNARRGQSVGDGELKGKDIKRLIGASMIGTEHETKFTVEGVWRKVRKVFPESLKAATKLTVEDARAQWTTHDNLNQWFDDAKQNLINTGLVIDKEVLDDKGAMVSEVLFRKDTGRRIINMDETHHDLSITGDRGRPHAVSYHNPTFQCGATLARREVSKARHWSLRNQCGRRGPATILHI